MKNKHMLLDKNIVVFGSNSEINIKIADEILFEKPNKVFYVSTEAFEFTEKENIEVIQMNFYEKSNLESLVDLLAEVKIDGMVYAGGIGGVRPLKLNSPEFISQMFHYNVFTFFEIIRLFTKKRLINDGASIVALSSVSSIKGLKSKSAYSASKAALDAAVKGIAAELADKKIRINSIQKGWVSADLQKDFIQDSMSLDGGNDLSKQLLGVIEPEEIARLTTFLLSDSVKTMTGVNIVLDGGYTL